MQQRFRSLTFGAVLVLTTAGAIGWAVPAQAADPGTAQVDSATTVFFSAGIQQANSITVTRSGRTVTIDDRVAINPGSGCTRVGRDTTKVTCTTSETPTRVSIWTEDGNDSITNKSNLVMFGWAGSGNDIVNGGEADDSLVGAGGNDTVNGGAGTDNLYGDAGTDILNGGAGDDVLDSGAGPDSLNGGPGTDVASYLLRTQPIAADLDGQDDDGENGEKDTIATDVENIMGGKGADTITGNSEDNHLQGNDGNDVVKGGGGNDVLRAGEGADTVWAEAGDDTIYAGDGNDTVHGGAGADNVSAGGGSDTVDGEAGGDTLYGDAGDDNLYGDRAGDVDTQTDYLDGGAHDAVSGDYCDAGPFGTTVNCER